MKKVSVKQLEKSLQVSWCKDTCWPDCWEAKNPAAGHCRVTALVVQKLLGGRILFAEISKKPKYTHFWNKLPGGREVDLTLNQFKSGTVIPIGKNISVKDALNAPNIKKTFPILLAKVKEQLK